MTQPKISVIIPVYNVEKYLDECVCSVRAQTLQDIEIILVDDASPDECPRMCDEYAAADSRIRVVHQENRGLGGARNSGLKIVRGKYVFFLDSDDWIVQNGLEWMFRQAERTGADVVLTGETLFMEDTGKFAPGWRDYFNVRGTRRLRGNNLIKTFTPGCCRLYRMEFIKKNELRFVEKCFFEDNSWGEFIILLANYAAFVPSVYFYRQRGASITGHFDMRGTDMVKDFAFFCDYVRMHNIRSRKLKLCHIWQMNRFVYYTFNLPSHLRMDFLREIRPSIAQMRVPVWYLWHVCRKNKLHFSIFRKLLKYAPMNTDKYYKAFD